MTALGSYSQYETLVFLQSVARHGADKSAINDIANALAKNQLIGSNNHYDPARFKPDGLHDLYDQLVVRTYQGAENKHDESRTQTTAEPEHGAIKSRKRKLSTTPPRSASPSEQQFVQRLVDRLYRKFREDTIAELRQDEATYAKLQRDIDKLEGKQIKLPRKPTPPVPKEAPSKSAVPPSSPPSRRDQADPVSVQLQADFDASRHDTKLPVTAPAQPTPHQSQAIPVHALIDRAQNSPAPAPGSTTSKSASGTPQPRYAQLPPPPASAQHPSPGPSNRTLPPPSPQHGTYGSVAPGPHGYNQPVQGATPAMSSLHNLQRLPSQEHPSIQRSHSQGRASPMPPQQPPYSPYPQFPQPPPSQGWHSPVPQPYYPQSARNSPHQYPPHGSKYPQTHNHTPHQAPFHPYPHTAPAPYHGQQAWRGLPVPPYQPYPAAATTPIPRPSSRASLSRSGSVTPWRRKPLPHHLRPRSPSRTDRNVSPLSDTEMSTQDSKDLTSTGKSSSLVSDSQRQSESPIRSMSRSQSVTSEGRPPPKRPVGRPPRNRTVAPSTPASAAGDVEAQQRSSERRGRTKVKTYLQPGTPKSSTVGKGKRETLSVSPAPPPPLPDLPQSLTSIKDITASTDASFVLVSKSFSKTAQLLLNEITAHKLAGIFAKPLSERDAPGYKDLIQRPQDLKSIKAAMVKGSKLAAAAIEDLETQESQNAPDEAYNDVKSSLKEGPIGNGFYLIKSNDDLVPPRGIVNSAQLETELVRMFANAIMFNPLPSSERGFGRSLRLRKRGGEILSSHTDQDGAAAARAAAAAQQVRDSSEDSSASESTSDEQGIISDAREMFHDVSALVAKWREVEEEKIGAVPSGLTAAAGGSNLSTPLVGEQKERERERDRDRARHASVTASSNGGEDDREGTPSLAMSRKRRKIEH